MHDLSATSHLWYLMVIHAAEQAYQRFATASPIEKLQVTPAIPEELTIGNRLMTLYAPDGESEKTLTLNKLQNPTRTQQDAWMPSLQQKSSGHVTPDPAILVKAVAGITAGVFDKGQNSEIAFRVSLVRSLLQVDSKPTMDTVMQLRSPEGRGCKYTVRTDWFDAYSQG